MYRFSFTNSVAGKAMEVNRQLFHEIISRQDIKDRCKKIADLVEKENSNDEALSLKGRAGREVISQLKRSLPAFCWHAWFDKGKRNNKCAHPSGLIMIDVDHVEQPQQMFAQIEAKAKTLGLLVAHITPSTKGLRLVFPIPHAMDLVKAQTYFAHQLNLQVDACTKDLARLSFAVPEEYFLYIDEDKLWDDLSPRSPLQGEGRNLADSQIVAATSRPLVGETERGYATSEQTEESSSGGIPSLLSLPLHGREEKDGGSNLAKSADNEGCRGAIHSVPNGEDAMLDDRNGINSAPTSYEETSATAATSRPLVGETERGYTTSEQTEKSVVPTTAATLNSQPSTLNEADRKIGERESVKLNPTDESEKSVVTTTAATLNAFEDNYDGIPYKILVESLCELLGGTPAHGSRNNFIFSMAAYLRYVCNDDPEWIKSVLPTYGETEEKWSRTIESACQRAQYKVMPNVVKRAIDQAHHKVDMMNMKEDDEQNALPPAMPARLPFLIHHLIKNVPEVCRPAVANAVFPALAAHLHGVKFWLKDGTEKEATFMCVTMAGQSSGKSSVNKPIEYITADIVERDEINRKREDEWKESTQTKGANKEKPKRPDDLCVQVLVSDMTNAAFVQRMKDAGDHYLYTNLEELDLLKQLQTNGTKDVGKIICLCFDNGTYGQERVGTQSVTARVDIRWNWNASSTIQKGISFFKGRLVDGTLSRINFCTIIRDKSKPFVYGKYDEDYAEKLKPFIANLNLANGHIECKQALALANKMAADCEENAALADDDAYQELAYRAVTIAYLKAMVLFIANDMTWTKEISDFAEWSLQYDLWCKMHFFGDQLKQEAEKEVIKKTRGKKNLLNLLPNAFKLDDVSEMRRLQGLNEKGTRQMLNNWLCRGYIEYDDTLMQYFKSENYLSRHAA